jgi:hypothetical protein
MVSYGLEGGLESMEATGSIMLILGYLGGLLNVVMTVLVILACIKYLREK